MPPVVSRALLLALASLLALAAPAGAQTADPLEAIWQFNGGQIAVEKQPDGSFLGTVIRPTTISRCAHQNGERIWTEVRAQPDGQYFGKHQYLRDSDCVPVERGNAAYRILTKPDGAQILRICFARPETPELQPNIAPDGSSTANDGCVDSDLISRLPQTPPKLNDIVTLPKQTKGCASRRRFAIRLREPKGDALASAVITLNRKRLPVRRSNGRLRSVVDLRGLPRGRYALKIVAKTVRGRTITGTRRYRTCGKVKRIGRVGPI